VPEWFELARGRYAQRTNEIGRAASGAAVAISALARGKTNSATFLKRHGENVSVVLSGEYRLLTAMVLRITCIACVNRLKMKAGAKSPEAGGFS
jgi:hypothetical protein